MFLTFRDERPEPDGSNPLPCFEMNESDGGESGRGFARVWNTPARKPHKRYQL
jgi:hypothetical protein